MGELGARGVETDRAFALGEGQDLVARHIDDLGIVIDEFPDQPRTRDAVRVRVLAGDPLHFAILFVPYARTADWGRLRTSAGRELPPDWLV